MAKLVSFSYSRLDAYETCPKNFWEVSVAKRVQDPGNEHSEYGDFVHKSFAKYFERGAALPLTLSYLEKYLKPIAAAPGEKLVEQKLAIDATYEGCDWFSKETYCRVISDLTVVNGNAAINFDWKTGKMKEDFTQLRLSSAVVMLHVPRIEKIRNVYFWTKHKKFTREEEVMDRDGIAKVFTELNPRIARYQEAHAKTDFPTRPGFKCRYCPVMTCPYNEVKKK